MRSLALSGILFFALATGTFAQGTLSGDAAVTYHWVRTNATPGQCGCFSMNGGGVSGSVNVGSGFAGVAEISAETARNVFNQGRSLTIVSYLGGVRYHLTQRVLRRPALLQPFVQVLAGAGHAGGSVAGSADGTYAFDARMGGGLDLRLNSVISVRAIQVDYNLTRFSNLDNGRQNNLLLGFGVAFHWSR